jgi:transcriptional regulator with XRE-family HTH domain
VDREAELSEFLKSRRARLRPEDAGVPYKNHGTRRVRGLRREELALLAGVSVAHYTRLEQGRSQLGFNQSSQRCCSAASLDAR